MGEWFPLSADRHFLCADVTVLPGEVKWAEAPPRALRFVTHSRRRNKNHTDDDAKNKEPVERRLTTISQ